MVRIRLSFLPLARFTDEFGKLAVEARGTRERGMAKHNPRHAARQHRGGELTADLGIVIEQCSGQPSRRGGR
jgi:hypothetical protein